MLLRRATALAILTLLFCSAGATRAASYGLTDLGTFGAFDATGINNNGQVVGSASDGENAYAFVYSGTVPPQNLGNLPGRNWTYGIAINDRGQVVGDSLKSGVSYSMHHAFLYTGSGPIQDLGTLAGSTSHAGGINDSGQVVGYASSYIYGTPFSNTRAFLYSGNGPMQDLGALPTGQSSGATGINNLGQIAGWAEVNGYADMDYHYGHNHAFLYSAGGPMQDLGTLGGLSSCAYGINDSGQVVGYATNAAGYSHAFLFTGSGPMQDLGTLGGLGSLCQRHQQMGTGCGGCRYS